MVKTPARLRLCISLLCLNLAFIWGNSLLPAELSGAFSHWVRDILSGILGLAPESSTEEGHHILRKLAHFTEFACLGLCLHWLVAMLRKRPWHQPVLPLLSGFLAACVDETIQCFVPGRGPGMKDVAIDTLGVLTGILLINCIKTKFWRKMKQ